MCSILSVEKLVLFEDAIVQRLLDMCLYGVWSLILTKPYTNQI